MLICKITINISINIIKLIENIIKKKYNFFSIIGFLKREENIMDKSFYDKWIGIDEAAECLGIKSNIERLDKERRNHSSSQDWKAMEI